MPRPFEVADLHLSTFNLHAALVFDTNHVFGVDGDACDRLHLSTCLSGMDGLAYIFAFHMVVPRRTKRFDNGDLRNLPCGSTIMTNF